MHPQQQFELTRSDLPLHPPPPICKNGCELRFNKRRMQERLTLLRKQLQLHSYGEKYVRWQCELQKERESQEYPQLLGHFLEAFPFNHKYWLEYIQLTKFEEYQTALLRTPKSYELWTGYLAALRANPPDDPLRYRKELEKAIIEIGADSRSLFLYQEYYLMVNEAVRFEFYKKVFTRALIGLESLHQQFQIWFATLTDPQLAALATKELKNAALAMTAEEQRAHLRLLIEAIYAKTVNYRDRRLQVQDQIQVKYFDGSALGRSESALWRELIELQRANGIVENISYCYQRSLMAQTEDLELWEEVFHYMENETNKYTKVLSILRNNRQFFLTFDLNLYFYWCDLEERENPAAARKMYQQLVATTSHYPAYERWIQLEIREKQWATAKTLYDSLMGLYQGDMELLVYVVVEYSEFVVKYYKDLEYAKKLLKTYFEHLPFSQYLFTKYLDFLKHFENKEGYYDELMQLIAEALAKAKHTLPDPQFASVLRTLRYYLRSTLTSIYLIKLSERKMMEVEEKLKTN